MAITLNLLDVQKITISGISPQLAASCTIQSNGGPVYLLRVGNIPADTPDVLAYLNAQAADLYRQATERGDLADPDALVDKLNADDLIARWKASPIYNKSPAEIYTLMQGAMDSWTSLADARTSLRVWLPLMAAAIAWMAMRPYERP